MKPDQERVFIGMESRTNMDQMTGAKVDNHSWKWQGNDGMTLMTLQQEAGKVSSDRCTKKVKCLTF